MQFNQDKHFVGIAALKQKHAGQIAQFREWSSRKDWERFHSSHYDWWAFPISQPSAYGLAYSVFAGEVGELKQDASFVADYRQGIELVAASWGWDLAAGAALAQPAPGQSWHHWPVRLFKAAQSVQLFGYPELFDSLNVYAHILMKQGQEMSYGGHDLSWLFK